MEGVGARLGRSSTRYGGPTTVFNGPVRRWKKKWVHVSSPFTSTTAAASTNHHHNNNSHHYSQSPNPTLNGNNGSNVLLFKWTPIPNSTDKTPVKDDASVTHPDDPTRKKFKYIPIAVLEEQKDESAEQVEDEDQADETDLNAVDPTFKVDDSGEKPDINDIPMEESQVADKSQVKRQDLNESTLDLSLG